MQTNKISNRTHFTSFYVQTEKGFVNLARNGNKVSINAFADGIIRGCKKDSNNFKTLDIAVDGVKMPTFLNGKQVQDFSKLKYIEDKLEFFNKYLEKIGIKKEKIALGDTKAFDTYILS